MPRMGLAMFEVHGVTKVYPEGRNEVRALDAVCFEWQRAAVVVGAALVVAIQAVNGSARASLREMINELAGERSTSAGALTKKHGP